MARVSFPTCSAYVTTKLSNSLPPLKISISGVRGIVGESLTPDLIANFSQAFGTYIDSGPVLVCMDTRPSGNMVKSAVIAGLIATGCEVIDLNICPTPTMQIMIPELNAKGGIAITAGHNPENWNALKFIRDDGIYFNALQGEELLDIYHQSEFTKVDWKTIKKIHCDITSEMAIKRHIDVILKKFDISIIKTHKFKVALDFCNAACALIIPKLLKELHCDAVSINDDILESFPHDPEPTVKNMSQLKALVKASRADIGFAYDANGERLGIVTEKGEALPEEFTFLISSEIEFAKMDYLQSSNMVGEDKSSIEAGPHICPAVTNISTSMQIDEIAARYGGKVQRTNIGQSYVAEALKYYNGIIGGEGNGGVMLPRIQFANDSAAAFVNILEYMAKSGARISKVFEKLPKYPMIKRNIMLPTEKIFSIMERIRNIVEKDNFGASIDYSDGIKLIWEDRWLHLRAANTESVLRFFAEAKDESKLLEMISLVEKFIRFF